MRPPVQNDKFEKIFHAIVDGNYKPVGHYGFATDKNARFGIDERIYAPNIVAKEIDPSIDKGDLRTVIESYSSERMALVTDAPDKRKDPHSQWLIVTPNTLRQLRNNLISANYRYSMKPRKPGLDERPNYKSFDR